MGGSSGDMLAAARRDPNFRGIDPAALGQLVKQAMDAQNAVQGWLSSHQPPPGVPATGYQQAATVEQWTTTQMGMLTRRRNYAITHPDTGGGMSVPSPPAGPAKVVPKAAGGGTPGISRHPKITPHGAGPHLGHFPTTGAAIKAANAAAAAIKRAEQNHTPIPASIWKQIEANINDPDYTKALYERLGAAGTAGLIAAAGHDQTELHALSQSLGMASRHHTFDEKWLHGLLAESARLKDRTTAVQVLTGAHLSGRSATALQHLLGLGHVTKHSFPPSGIPVHRTPVVHHTPVPKPVHHTPAHLKQHHLSGASAEPED